MKDTALTVAGAIFFLAFIVHLFRIALKIEIVVAGFVVPMWSSIFGFIIALFLSLWMFKSIKSAK